MSLKHYFGLKLKRLREQRGLTPKELAWLSGLHRVHIHMIESGARKSPTISTRLKLAKILNVDIKELLD